MALCSNNDDPGGQEDEYAGVPLIILMFSNYYRKLYNIVLG